MQSRSSSLNPSLVKSENGNKLLDMFFMVQHIGHDVNKYTVYECLILLLAHSLCLCVVKLRIKDKDLFNIHFSHSVILNLDPLLDLYAGSFAVLI